MLARSNALNYSTNGSNNHNHDLNSISNVSTTNLVNINAQIIGSDTTSQILANALVIILRIFLLIDFASLNVCFFFIFKNFERKAALFSKHGENKFAKKATIEKYAYFNLKIFDYFVNMS